MSYATATEFLARIDDKQVEDLVGLVGDVVNEPRITVALSDASAELDGYKPRIPAKHWPEAATLRLHCIKVATYLLTLDRPGKEYEQIRNAYTDTIAFYTGIINGAAAQAAASDGDATSPQPVFDDDTLKGFV